MTRTAPLPLLVPLRQKPQARRSLPGQGRGSTARLSTQVNCTTLRAAASVSLLESCKACRTPDHTACSPELPSPICRCQASTLRARPGALASFPSAPMLEAHPPPRRPLRSRSADLPAAAGAAARGSAAGCRSKPSEAAGCAAGVGAGGLWRCRYPACNIALGTGSHLRLLAAAARHGLGWLPHAHQLAVASIDMPLPLACRR